MADYSYYTGVYLGDVIPEAAFPRLAARADAELARYKRIYSVTAPEPDSENKAICAMAEALYSFEQAMAGTLSGCTVGGVSSSYTAPQTDVSPKAQAAALYRSAGQYLRIYRGCG